MCTLIFVVDFGRSASRRIFGKDCVSLVRCPQHQLNPGYQPLRAPGVLRDYPRGPSATAAQNALPESDTKLHVQAGFGDGNISDHRFMMYFRRSPADLASIDEIRQKQLLLEFKNILADGANLVDQMDLTPVGNFYVELRKGRRG